MIGRLVSRAWPAFTACTPAHRVGAGHARDGEGLCLAPASVSTDRSHAPSWERGPGRSGVRLRRANEDGAAAVVRGAAPRSPCRDRSIRFRSAVPATRRGDQPWMGRVDQQFLVALFHQRGDAGM